MWELDTIAPKAGQATVQLDTDMSKSQQTCRNPKHCSIQELDRDVSRLGESSPQLRGSTSCRNACPQNPLNAHAYMCVGDLGACALCKRQGGRAPSPVGEENVDARAYQLPKELPVPSDQTGVSRCKRHLRAALLGNLYRLLMRPNPAIHIQPHLLSCASWHSHGSSCSTFNELRNAATLKCPDG